MFSVSLYRAEHTKRYSISQLTNQGWEVKAEEDLKLTHRALYHDWHRVERALVLFRLKISELTARGWVVGEPCASGG
jgi:hypothetical protein